MIASSKHKNRLKKGKTTERSLASRIIQNKLIRRRSTYLHPKLVSKNLFCDDG